MCSNGYKTIQGEPVRLTPRILGLSVQLARQEACITQAELAKRANVSRKWLSALENGKEDVNLSMVLRLLSELNFTLDIRRQEMPKSEGLSPNSPNELPVVKTTYG